MKDKTKNNKGSSKKKKVILTILGIIGGILLIALIIFLFFPGLPACMSAKHKYKHIDELPAEFEKVEVTGSKTAIQGLKIFVPDGWRNNESGNGMSSEDENQSLLVLHADLKSQEDALKEMFEDPQYAAFAYDPWEAYDHEEYDYRHFFNTLHVELPKYGLSSVFIFYIRDSFTAKSAIWLEHTDMEVFKELCEVKENAFESENLWKMQGDGFKAYVGQVNYEDIGKNMWTVTIFPDGDLNDDYNVTIKCDDENTVRQIISSIELANK